MTHLLACLLALGTAVFAQSVPSLTLTVTTNPNYIADMNTHWTAQTAGTFCTLASSVGASDTTISCTQAPANFTAGMSIAIGNEAMIATALNGSTVSVTRGTAAFPFLAIITAAVTAGVTASQFAPATTHASGGTVSLLKYSDPGVMINAEKLIGYMVGISQGLGASSATNYTVTTLSVSH